MKIIGITRVRNEVGVIENTLDHVSKFVDGIYVMDDASEDATVQVCEKHEKVRKVLVNRHWDSTPRGRNEAEGTLRQRIYEEALKEKPDWIYCFDADEYIEPIEETFNPTFPYYYFRLFDFYITEQDVDKHYLQRTYIGPECRDIPMLFNTSLNWIFHQRVPDLSGSDGFGKFGGFVRHYGKAISVRQFEKDVDYYVNVRWNDSKYRELQERWRRRKGKAIHIVSDFGRPLITWDQRKDMRITVKL